MTHIRHKMIQQITQYVMWITYIDRQTILLYFSLITDCPKSEGAWHILYLCSSSVIRSDQYFFFFFLLTKQASPSLLEVAVILESKPLITMVSSIYTYIVIHIQTYNSHAYLYSQSYKLSYILLSLSNLAICFFNKGEVFFYIQCVFKMGQVRQNVNGEHILVV